MGDQLGLGQVVHLVEGNGGTEDRVDDVGVAIKLLVDHKAKDAHLGGTSVVELNSLSAVDTVLSVVRLARSLKIVLDGSKSELDNANE